MQTPKPIQALPHSLTLTYSTACWRSPPEYTFNTPRLHFQTERIFPPTTDFSSGVLCFMTQMQNLKCILEISFLLLTFCQSQRLDFYH